MDQATLKDVCARFNKLYSGAIADMLDKRGFRNQVLPYFITPMTDVRRVCGVAFTGQGYPCANTSDDDTEKRLAMLDSITPYTISVWACGGHKASAHWGEIMSTAARERGCMGAVLDGGVRDLDFINAMQFPVFARFRCAGSSIGRWNIMQWQTPIRIIDTVVNPGDLVFGDADGVVIIPADVIMEILVEAEDVYARESGMRRELRQGVSIKDAYKKYGAF
ncbi:MAG: RraA family protein [Candidatus Korobacteraceae bacterium]|jgi:regulator of RNase E activity RraA